MKKDFIVDFIGIGVAKSGTTWVANMLDAHPDVCLSEPKEVNYFNSELNSNATIRYRGEPGPFLNKNYNKPISWFKYHFKHCKVESVKGEFSPVYFYDPAAPEAIKRTYPDVKLIAVFRNPIDRAYSEYWMFRNAFRIEDRSFDEAVREEGVMYIQKGLYHKQLMRYLELFDNEQILVVFYDDIREDSRKMLGKIYAFLGVDDTFVPNTIDEKSNYAKAARIKGSVELMNTTVKLLVQMRLLFLVRLLRKIKFNKFLLRIISKKTQYSSMEESTREYLRGVFSEDIQKLEELLEVDLAHWK